MLFRSQIDPTIYLNDPVTHVADVNYGPISPALAGLSFWLQGVVLDLGAFLAPFAATNAWRIDF